LRGGTLAIADRRSRRDRRRIGDVTRVRVGTSGWNYTEWKGSFYPDDLKPAAMLPYYAERFSTVEVNATFYRMPTPKVVAAGRPPCRRPSRSAQGSTAHQRTSRACATSTRRCASSATSRGGSAPGWPLLFQLPPNFKKDVGASATSFIWCRRISA